MIVVGSVTGRRTANFVDVCERVVLGDGVGIRIMAALWNRGAPFCAAARFEGSGKDLDEGNSPDVGIEAMRCTNVDRGISTVDGSELGVHQTMLRSKDVGRVGHKKVFGNKALSNSLKGCGVLDGELHGFFALSDDLDRRRNDPILFLEPSSLSQGFFDFFRTVLEQDQGIIEGTDGFV